MQDVSSNGHVLSQSVLDGCWERAPTYDHENRFFDEDFDELRRAGYLRMPVPKELGGLGFTLAESCKEQRRLAYYAHASALAINMHLYWVGVAADLWRAGDKSLEWLLTGALDGEVYAAGHAEGGNDVPMLYSSTTAERVDGGYRFSGRKSFGSLTPVWTYLGIHGMDSADPDNRKVVHAFVPRHTQGVSIIETWDTMGMRATRSDDTMLDNVFVADEHIGRVVPVGFAGIDPFVITVFAWALLGFANVYYGLARRAFDMAVANVKDKTVIAMTRPMAYHAAVQYGVAEMGLDLESVEPHIERVAQDWSDGVDHGPMWGVKIVAAKHKAVESCYRVVDTALDLSGGFAIFRKSGMERLFRDARLGRIHPANSALTHEIVGKAFLGVDMDEQPRWG